jgi:hypothetical protein
MSSNVELKEAPLVEERTDHTIKPKKVKKTDHSTLELPKAPTEVDAENVTRNRDIAAEKQKKPKKPRKKRVLTEEQKQRMREGRMRKKMKRIETHKVTEKKKTQTLGSNVMRVDEEKKPDKAVADAPDSADLFSRIPLGELPVGTQLAPFGLSDIRLPHLSSLDLFSILDQEVLDLAGISSEIANVEHSSALGAGASFHPTRTIFNQNASFLEKATGEFASHPERFQIEQKSTVPELGKYENMLEVQPRMEYMREFGSKAASVGPQYAPESVRSLGPGKSQPGFVRSIKGKSQGFNQNAGTVQY